MSEDQVTPEVDAADAEPVEAGEAAGPDALSPRQTARDAARLREAEPDPVALLQAAQLGGLPPVRSAQAALVMAAAEGRLPDNTERAAVAAAYGPAGESAALPARLAAELEDLLGRIHAHLTESARPPRIERPRPRRRTALPGPSLAAVLGIGPALEARLIAAGITDVETLASVSAPTLCALLGPLIGEEVAQAWINRARDALAATKPR